MLIAGVAGTVDTGVVDKLEMVTGLSCVVNWTIEEEPGPMGTVLLVTSDTTTVDKLKKP